MANDSGDGGLLGGFQGFSPLTNFGLGLLSQSGPSLTPQSPFQAIGRAAQYTSEAQQQAMQNQLIRAKLLESTRQQKAQADVEKLIASGGLTVPGMSPAVAAALVASGDTTLLGKFIPQALTPEATAMLNAGYPAIAKAQLDLTKEQQLGKLEENTANTTIENAVEANAIIDRMNKGPVPPGSNAALIVKKFSDPETGFLNASPAKIAEVISTASGKKFTPEQAYAFQTDWNRLNKLSSKFILDQRALQTQQGAVGGQSRQTDMGLSLLQNTNISPGITGDANKLILRDLVQKQFNVGEIRGWKLKNADQGQQVLTTWDKELTPKVDYSTSEVPVPGAPGATVAGVPGVSAEPSLSDRVLSGAGSVYNKVFGPAAPQAAPVAAPAVPGPAPRAVKTQNIVPVPGYGDVPKFARQADGQRAVKKGEYFVAPDPQTGALSLWQK